jgi:hypothetical protein
MKGTEYRPCPAGPRVIFGVTFDTGFGTRGSLPTLNAESTFTWSAEGDLMLVRLLLLVTLAGGVAAAIYVGRVIPEAHIDDGLSSLDGQNLIFGQFALSKAEASQNRFERVLATKARVAWVNYDFTCTAAACRMSCLEAGIDPDRPLMAKVALHTLFGVPLASFYVTCEGVHRESLY